MNRRKFLVFGAGVAAAVSVSGCAAFGRNRPAQAVAVTEVGGSGMKLTAVAVRYRRPVDAASVDASQFAVKGRTVTGVYVSNEASGAPAQSGRYVVVRLNPDDEGASLVKKNPPNKSQSAQASAGKGPGKAGEAKESAPTLQTASAEVSAGQAVLTSSAVVNKVFDDFKQFEYADKATGKTVRYNLFVPKNAEPGKKYPLVLFMHDAGVTGKADTRATLFQGNGATVWAEPESQAANPCFVLAPQFDEIIADDEGKTSNYLDAVINLIRALERQYAVDPRRRYTTGQSGGGMLSIAMNIKYPDFFAATYLVACQWDSRLVAPMAENNIWITVSQDDSKAYPGQTAIVAELARHGAKTARAVWNARWDVQQFQTAFDEIDAKKANVNFVAFAKGSVLDQGGSSGGGGHTNTWKYAYGIRPVREWIFRHSR